MIDLKIVGRNCRDFRIAHGYHQFDVAAETGYSKENISSFEHGRNDNYRIMLWYIIHGLPVSDLLRGGE